MSDENNSQRLKQRVVGAVVLVSLAVIFVPMLLDGDGGRPGDKGPMVPPKPGYRFETLEIPLEVPGTGTAQPAGEAAAPDVEPVAPPAPKPVSAPTPPPKPAATRTTTRSQPATPAPDGGWLVQAGSFSRQANADGLRDRLKAAGYPAYTESVKAEGKGVYRVRIGPYGSKREAEAQLAPVAKGFGVQPMVLGNR